MRIMEEVEKLLHWLSNVLENRVFVALTRGLWDLTSKDVLDYTEDLREGRGGQRVSALHPCPLPLLSDNLLAVGSTAVVWLLG